MKSFRLSISSISLVAIASLQLASCNRVDRPELDLGAVDSANLTSNVVALETESEPNAESVSWSRFRGPNGTGISDSKGVPMRWSETNNLSWKTALPGAGSSSPILTSSKVFVTSYSGYGVPDSARSGSAKNLKRHLSCIDRATGKIQWTKTVDNLQKEDPYSGMGVPEHGYATNTPATDGQSVFVFYGKTGVIAYDLSGNELWKKSVGTDSANRRWGSAASLVLIDDKLIVNAAEESQAIYALDKSSGKQIWKSEAASLELSYSTPAVVNVDEERTELVVAVPGEVWGLNVNNGKLAWYVETSLTGNVSPSVIVNGKNVFVFGGYRSSGSVAIRAGGKGDVTDTNVLWSSRESSYVSTPVLHKKRFYWIDDKGIYHCLNAETGEQIHRERLSLKTNRGRTAYASPVVVGGKIYAQTRYNGLMVFEPSEKMELIQQNKFNDESQFNATPAIHEDQMFLRSDRYLYCVKGT